MQLASWLLLHRAVNEGEMSLAQANKEKTKVKLAVDEPIDHNAVKGLPQQLRDLIERSSILHDKVRRLDATIHAPVLEEQATATPLDRQLGLLKAAFERRDERIEKS
jgi:regulator of CtrA degradation